MAVNILSSDSTTQWIANIVGDTYVLQEDVYLAVLGTAITGTAAVTKLILKNMDASDLSAADFLFL